MALIKIHSGCVTNGIFTPDNPQSWAIAFCVHEGKRVQVTVERERKHGSKAQQGYYFGVIIPLLMDYGYDKTEAHEAFKFEHLRIPTEDGYPAKTKRYRDLSTVEREEYHEACRRTLTKMGSYCPLPNEIDIR